MSNTNSKVEFDADYNEISSYAKKPNGLFYKITTFLVNKGLFKDAKTASYSIITLLTLALALSIFFTVKSSRPAQINKEVDPLTGQEVLPGQLPGQI